MARAQPSTKPARVAVIVARQFAAAPLDPETAQRNLCAFYEQSARDEIRDARRAFAAMRAEVRRWESRLADHEAEIALGEAMGVDMEQLQVASRKTLRMRVQAGSRLANAKPGHAKLLAEHRARVKSLRDIRDANIRVLRFEREK